MLAFLAAALAASVHPGHSAQATPTSPVGPPAVSPAPGSPAPESVAPESSAAEAPSTEREALESTMPWWERITVTVDHEGKQQSCLYETNIKPAKDCDEELAASIKAGGKGRTGVYSKVTFERRFNPGGKPDAGPMKPGDTLLGQQVMFLTIDGKGSISSCKEVATSGEAAPDYGCEGARKEKFRAHGDSGAAVRQAFMTILAYGHSEQIA